MFKLILTTLALSCYVHAASWFVTSAGADTNPGTDELPFATPQKALEFAQPGDTIFIPSIRTNTVHNAVTIRGGTSEGARIIIDGLGTGQLRQLGIRHPYITVQNFANIVGIPQLGESGFGRCGIYIDRNANFFRVLGNKFDPGRVVNVTPISMYGDQWSTGSTNAARFGIFAFNVTSNVCGEAAVNIQGRFNQYVSNWVGHCYSADFVRIFGHSNIVADCTFTNIIYQAGVGWHADFIQTFGETRLYSIGHIIERNRVSRIEQGQLIQSHMINSYNLGHFGGWIIRNNIFEYIDLQGSEGIPNQMYINNIFYRVNRVNGGHVFAIGNTAGRSDSTGIVIDNNVLLECGNPLSDQQGWYPSGMTNLLGNPLILSAKNNYIAKDGYLPVRTNCPGSTFRLCVEDGIINGGNPGFVNEAAGNFQLLPTSILINAGNANTNVTNDFVGLSRPQGANHDIGAYEFNSGSPPVETAPAAPSVLIASTLSSSQINLTWTDNANNESGFQIERAISANVNWVVIATVNANVVAYSSISLSPATRYYYRVRAFRTSTVSSYSNQANDVTDALSPDVVLKRTRIAN